MTRRLIIKAIVISCVLAMSGCASKLPSASQYSGFLQDYSGLQETTSASGAPVLRWIAPGFDPKHYTALVYEPVVYYPEARPNSQVGSKVLGELLNYTNTTLKNAASQRYPLAEKPGANTLIFRGAITAVNTSDRDIKPRELIPIALVIAGTRAATGLRPKDTNLYFEGELLDGATRQPVVKVVRKGQGIQVDNAEQQVTFADLKSVVDGLAADAVMFNAAQRK